MRLARLRREWNGRMRTIRRRVELGELRPFEALGEHMSLYSSTVSALVDQILGFEKPREATVAWTENQGAAIRRQMNGMDNAMSRYPIDMQHLYVLRHRKGLTFAKAVREARDIATGVIERLS